jgi:GalNAc-alpha-(1->4)-GalNAc-alpha-(1->3)-diNAcBac-PP-undecaprenol alpha-1,4-N-acetyl-D-galactosaminyltransferase
MRLTIVVSNVRGGGSTFAAVNWANAWAARGKTVSIVAILPDEGEGADFLCHQDITLHRVDLSDQPVHNKIQAAVQILRNLARLRKLIRQTNPEIVISFDGPINTRTLMACTGLRVPIIVMEQVHPGQYSFGRFWERMRRRVYPRAATVVNLTQQATEWSREHLGLTRTATIPNPVLPPPVRKTPNQATSRLVVAAGRLVDQKRFDLLIGAFALVSPAHPDWRLVIYGEGANRHLLEQQIQAAGLSGRISLPGWAKALSERMAQGEFFVLSSEYEGFGNVIVEALAVGLPVVSFDCPSGPGEIIRHEVDGLLAPPLDVPALAAAMGRLMADDGLRARFSARAPEALERFSLARTLGLWDECLRSAMAYQQPKGR